MITITVNGKKQEIEKAVTLPSFLEAHNINSRMVAVGYNGEVVPRDKWSEVTVKEGDVLDIVHMVGGG